MERNKKKLILIIVVIAIIIIAALSMASVFSGPLKLVKTSVSGNEGTSNGNSIYNYFIEGEFINMPFNKEGYDVKCDFYDTDGKLVGSDSKPLSYCDSSSPTTIGYLQTNSLIEMDHVEVIVYDTQGEVVLQQTIDYNMDLFKLKSSSLSQVTNNTTNQTLQGNVSE